MKAGKADHAFCPREAGEVVSAANRRGHVARRAGGGLLAPLLALLITVPAFAGWQDQATPRDVDRLGRLAESRARGLEEASKASPRDRAAIHSILNATTVNASEARLIGTWRCRTMKLGGMAPAVVYSWFRCRIARSGDGLSFEKVNGSQRTAGTLYSDGSGFVYLGASYVGKGYGPAEKKPAYSGGGASAGATATPDDQIGLFSVTADGRARLELPYPVQESTFDVIELKK